VSHYRPKPILLGPLPPSCQLPASRKAIRPPTLHFMTRHPSLGHPQLSHTATSLLKRLACALTLLSASAQAAEVTATWNAASDTPVTTSSYTATGNTVTFALNFAPGTGANLMVVKNTGLPFIQGTISNLAQGQAVALSFGAKTYNYVANYYAN
jgi:hypothetical protein